MSTKWPVKKRTFKCHITYNGNNNIASVKWLTDNLLFFLIYKNSLTFIVLMM